VLSLKGGAPELLVDVITRQLGAIIDAVAGDDADKPRRQLQLANDLLVILRVMGLRMAGPSVTGSFIIAFSCLNRWCRH